MIALCLLLVVGAPEEAPDFEAAKVAFQEGLDHLDGQRWQAAVDAFKRSLAIRESPPVLYNLALAQGRMKRPTRAIATLQRFVELVGAAPEADRARALIVKQRALISQVSLRVLGGAEQLWIDGKARSPKASLELQLDPGPHTFAVQREGYERVERAMELKSGPTEVTLRADARPLPARIRVRAEPNAELLVDGQLAGRGAYEGALSPGPHQLEVRAKDYLPERRKLQLNPGQSLDLQVRLQPRPLELVERWWFWAGLSALVVAGVTTGVVLGTRSSEPLNSGDLDRVLMGLGAR